MLCLQAFEEADEGSADAAEHMTDFRLEFPLFRFDGGLLFRFFAGFLLFDGTEAFLFGDAHRFLALKKQLFTKVISLF